MPVSFGTCFSFGLHSPLTFLSFPCPRWTIFALSILAWVFSIVVTASCDFISSAIEPEVSSLFFVDSFSDGLFCGKLDEEKLPYKENGVELSDSHKAAQAFAILNCLALTFCVVGVFLMIFVLREKASRLSWIATRIVFCVALAFSLATFSFYEYYISQCEEAEGAISCSAGPGAIIHAFLVIFQIALLIMAFMTPIPPSPVIKCGDCCCADLADENMPNDQKRPDA